METTSARPPGLRAITREAVRTRIADAAIELFAERGFDQVTVEQIAGHVGISARSFNRYFPTKEDAVLGDAGRWGEYVRDRLADRPAEEPAWDALHASFQALLRLSENHGEQQKRVMRLLSSTPALRARNLEKHLLWTELLTPLVADRLHGRDRTFQAEVLVQAGLACFDVALTRWARPDEKQDPATLLTSAFDAVTTLTTSN